MGYKRHKPVPEKVMLNERYHGHHTICQTLRDIYLEVGQDEIDVDKIRLQLRLSMAMAKSMHNKLKEYKKTLDFSEKME